ncbi:MAG TPA: hypothetical protein VMO26_29680 [Vicinamibacterales bacterium]|nr:hypothetical protein [Vicinamibacterales bacterium]
MKTARDLVIVAAVLAAGATAHAQVRVILSGDDRLAGIGAVDVVVTVIGDPTPQCAVSRPALQTGATDTLRAARIRATVSEKASSWHDTVMLNVQTIAAGDSCVSALTTELVAQVEGFPEADKFAAPDAWGSLYALHSV